ncbi:hypothetical protein [Paenibacillus terrigena]|uniref:hypothetical protein n=1 Tax=Paenibacillus terrigena TaxID=369333 RepID=UPI000380D662|nr:hypothetical protein [Paenibacillus terrigena]
MIRMGKPMAHNTFVIYVGTRIVEVVYANSFQQALAWARSEYGYEVYIMENIQVRDITWEVSV